MKTIYLHIGIGKTGTSSIQQHLANYHKEYLLNDLRYIQCTGGITGDGHQNFAKSFIFDVPDYMHISDQVMNSRDEVKSELVCASEKNILLSSENFQLASPLEIKKYFLSINQDYKFKIILFVRSQEELAESEYNQIVKVRLEKRSFFNYINSEFDGDFMRLASEWEGVFGRENLMCKIYDAKQKTAINDLLDCISGPNPSYTKNKNTAHSIENTSLGISALTIKRMINRLSADNSSNMHIELPKVIVDLIGLNDCPALMMDSNQAKQFRLRFKKSNIQFSKRYLGKKMIFLGGQRYDDQERDRIINIVDQLIGIRK